MSDKNKAQAEPKEAKKNAPEKKEEKKDHKLLIIIIILLLLLAVGAYFVVKNMYKEEDPDVAITKVINQSYDVWKTANGAAKDEAEAHDIIRDRGYVLEDLLLVGANRQVGWDSESNSYVLLEGSKIIYPEKQGNADAKIWTYVREVPAESATSVAWCGDVEVTTQEKVGTDAGGKDIMQDKVTVYSDHKYVKTVSGTTAAYKCNECGKNYTVKVK